MKGRTSAGVGLSTSSLQKTAEAEGYISRFGNLRASVAPADWPRDGRFQLLQHLLPCELVLGRLLNNQVPAVGVTLFDQKTDAIIFDVNFWHWRAIVEAIRSLGVIGESRVDALHQQFIGELTEDEARVVSAAIRERPLPTLGEDERLLLDGRRTTEPDDGTFYREPAEQHRNYSTNRRMLEEFAVCCETCAGFRVS